MTLNTMTCAEAEVMASLLVSHGAVLALAAAQFPPALLKEAAQDEACLAHL